MSPIAWIRYFLNHYLPAFNDKYIHLDQGGEVFNNLDIKNLLQSCGYTLHHIVSYTSSPNGPVEQAHRTLARSFRAMIPGANLGIKFWPYAFYRAIRLSNYFQEPNTVTSLVDKAISN